MKGNGISAALESIRKAFHDLHGDTRDRAQREASIALESATPQPPALERPQQPSRIAERSVVLIRSALRSPAIKECVFRRANVHQAWDVGDINQPTDLPALYERALRSLKK
jgi:hypothetical protein